MANTAFLKNLKAGDKVVLCITKDGEKHEYISKVKKITPTGLIRVVDYLFRDTTNIALGWEAVSIHEATPEKVKGICARECIKKIREVIANYDFTMTDEQAKAICEILGISA